MAARLALAASLLPAWGPSGALGARVRHQAASETGMYGVERTLGGVPIYNYDHVLKPVKRSDGVLVAPVQSWVLKLFDNVSTAEAQQMCNDGVQCIRAGEPSEGGLGYVEVNATEAEVTAMLARQHDRVEGVEPPMKIWSSRVPFSTPWGILRVQARLRVDVPKQDGHSSDGGKGVHVYVLDTGIRTTHVDFGGRAVPGFDGTKGILGKVCDPTDTSCAFDKNGHGTHCAGTVAGTVHGIAKAAKVHAVKVLGDDGGGNIVGIFLGMNWVRRKAKRPAVLSMSLGGPKSFLSNAAVSIFVKSGLTVVVAAGNEDEDACGYSPASSSKAITVGSTNNGDWKSGFSNYGTCVHIWAPGSDVISAGIRSDTVTDMMSGTSMACPHVSGAAALILAESPSLTPAEVKERLVRQATPSRIGGLQKEDSNLLLYTGKAD